MQRYDFIWYFSQICSSFLFFRACCCGGQRTQSLSHRNGMTFSLHRVAFLHYTFCRYNTIA
ncbi:MAG: hypothetical protein IKZ00_07645, partial [Bacteroidaceae bacterium]|nr:hypothetical protein [Bacteroidaceae bacterium]